MLISSILNIKRGFLEEIKMAKYVLEIPDAVERELHRLYYGTSFYSENTSPSYYAQLIRKGLMDSPTRFEGLEKISVTRQERRD